jgi:hypothetical protein
MKAYNKTVRRIYVCRGGVEIVRRRGGDDIRFGIAERAETENGDDDANIFKMAGHVFSL